MRGHTFRPKITWCTAVIRRVHDNEAAVIAGLYVRARRAAEPDVPPMVHSAVETEAWIAAQLADGSDTVVWVSEHEGQITAVMMTQGDWLDQLYVDPDRLGEGIGTRLLDHAKAMSPGTLQLWTFQSNTGAQRFYERHGFTEVERTDGSANEEHAADVRYVWSRAPFMPGVTVPG